MNIKFLFSTLTLLFLVFSCKDNKSHSGTKISDKSGGTFAMAKQLLINEAVVITLWYEESYRLLTNKFKGLRLNPIRYYDLTKTYKVK